MLIFSIFNSVAQTEKIKNGHFEIRCDKDVEAYALSSAHILNFVWDKLEEIGFNPPNRLKFNLVKSERDILFLDRGKQIITLEYTTLDMSKTWRNYVYGLCHEMGHLCMFQIIPNRNNWMTIAYREGWAHVLGDSMTVLLHEKNGIDVWPTPYDYLSISNAWKSNRLQVIEKDENQVDFFISVAFWEKLVEEMGIDKMPYFFRQVKSNRVRNPNADKKLRAKLVKLNISSDLLNYFDQNKQYLIRLEK